MSVQAIVTKYLGPTDHRGARIKATSASGLSATVSYEHAFSGETVHFEAVKALCGRLGWDASVFKAGGTRDGYAWVNCNA